MNTTDVINIYHKIVDMPPDLRANGPDGRIHEGYSKAYIYQLLHPLMIGMHWPPREPDKEEDQE